MNKFNFSFRSSAVQELLANNWEWHEWHIALSYELPKWDITTVERVSGFMAQCMHESAYFLRLTENLNYSASALNKIFPKYFVQAGRNAQDYHRSPEDIANIVYANRMGNGDEDSGDGWRYRGRGLIQLTGKDNYRSFAADLGMTLDDVPTYLESKQGAIQAACWFWKDNDINRYCDTQDIVGMTKRINGGTYGLEDRAKHFLHALDLFDGDSTPIDIDYNQIVQLGSRGPIVADIQTRLGIDPADGIYGPMTVMFVRQWQTGHGLQSDGVMGPHSIKVLLG
jgi:putative chitinase